jgi:hypothetical protein
MTRIRIFHNSDSKFPETTAVYDRVKLKHSGTPMLHMDVGESNQEQVKVCLSLPDEKGGGTHLFLFEERISLMAIFRACDLDFYSFIENQAIHNGTPADLFVHVLETTIRTMGHLSFSRGSDGEVIAVLELCNRRISLSIDKEVAALHFVRT